MASLAFPLVVVLAWTVAWFTYLAPKLRAYRRTAGIMAELDAGEHAFLHWVELHLRGLKTVAVSALVSGLAALKAAADAGVSAVAGLEPADLDPLRNAELWRAFLSDRLVLQVIAGLGLATAMLAIKGHLRAAEGAARADGGPR